MPSGSAVQELRMDLEGAGPRLGIPIQLETAWDVGAVVPARFARVRGAGEVSRQAVTGVPKLGRAMPAGLGDLDQW